MTKKFNKYSEKGLMIGISQLDKGIYLLSVEDSRGNSQRTKFAKN